MDEIRSHCQHRRIVVIEDCAQALGGTYKGRPLGSDGLAGIFSLSHFFPSLTGGAVVSGDARLRAHVARLEQAGTRALALFSFCIKLALQNHARTSKTAGFALRLDEFASAGDPHSSRLLLAENICGLKGVRDELEVRRRNYQLYRRLLPDHAELQALEADAVPQVLPLMHPSREALEKTAFSLRGLGLDTGVHLFDANRNIFNERRVPCVPLPVHGGIDTALVGRVVEIIRRHR